MVKFVKKDLQDGDIIVHRDGTVGVYIAKFGNIVYGLSFNHISDFNNSLENDEYGIRDEENKKYDIMEIYRPKKSYQCNLSPFCYEQGELVYERI